MVDPMELLHRLPVVRDVVSETASIRRQLRSHESVPAALYAAQFLLFVIMAVYFTKLAMLAMGVTSGYGDQQASVIIYIVDVAMLLTAVDAVLGIQSRRPASWRKVMRSAILLFLFSVAGMLVGTGMSASSLVTFSPIAVAAICIPVSFLMFTGSVRRYYVHPMLEMPPLGRWVVYILFSRLFPARGYELYRW